MVEVTGIPWDDVSYAPEWSKVEMRRDQLPDVLESFEGFELVWRKGMLNAELMRHPDGRTALVFPSIQEGTKSFVYLRRERG